MGCMSDTDQTITSCQSAVIAPHSLSLQKSQPISAFKLTYEDRSVTATETKHAEEKWCNWTPWLETDGQWELTTSPTSLPNGVKLLWRWTPVRLNRWRGVKTVAVRSRTAWKEHAPRVTPVSTLTHSQFDTGLVMTYRDAQRHALTRDRAGGMRGPWRMPCPHRDAQKENVYFYFIYFFAGWSLKKNVFSYLFFPLLFFIRPSACL